MVDSTAITALAAVGGSVVGGLASFVTTYFSQRHQTRRERLFSELGRRERLYGKFINRAAALFLDSIDKHLDKPADLVSLFALIARIRLTASPEVIAASEAVLRELMASYQRPPLDPREIFNQTREDLGDPLANFTEACRIERELLIGNL